MERLPAEDENGNEERDGGRLGGLGEVLRLRLGCNSGMVIVVERAIEKLKMENKY